MRKPTTSLLHILIKFTLKIKREMKRKAKRVDREREGQVICRRIGTDVSLGNLKVQFGVKYFNKYKVGILQRRILL